MINVSKHALTHSYNMYLGTYFIWTMDTKGFAWISRYILKISFYLVPVTYNGVPVEEWIERQYAIFATLLSWVQIQSRTPGFFIQKIPL